jgi:hypothetical protein
MKKVYSKPQIDAVVFASSDLTNAIDTSTATTLASDSNIIVKTSTGGTLKFSDLHK